MEQTSERFEQVTFPELMCGAQAFPVKTSVYRETNWDLKGNVRACFSQLQSLLEIQKKKIDPTCYSLKTLKIYYQLIEEPTSSPFSLNWPKSGTMHSGTLKIQNTGCHKTENGFSLLPQNVFDLIDRPYSNKTVIDIVENDIDEKYYLKQEQTEKLLEKLDQKSMDMLLSQIEDKDDKTYPCLTPERINKRQNGKRLKQSDEPMYTLIAQDKHGLVEIKQLIGGSQGNRVYSPNGLSTTLCSKSGGTAGKTGLYAFVDMSKTKSAITHNSRCIVARQNSGLTNFSGATSGILQMKKTVRIRRLTPRECFRLQGMPKKSIDDAFKTIIRDKPISDSQLYKIAGNGVTVPVITAIAEAIKRASL